MSTETAIPQSHPFSLVAKLVFDSRPFEISLDSQHHMLDRCNWMEEWIEFGKEFRAAWLRKKDDISIEKMMSEVEPREIPDPPVFADIPESPAIMWCSPRLCQRWFSECLASGTGNPMTANVKITTRLPRKDGFEFAVIAQEGHVPIILKYPAHE